jgi:murein DD-endopeptidase MepM/ murein hydrolase activator NlpD
VNGIITSGFGYRYDPNGVTTGFHPGVDIAAPIGTPIHAAQSGTIAYAGWEEGYGNYTCIDHGGGFATCYGHQSAIYVKVGDHVTRGQTIGAVGSTGFSTGPHCHFETRVDGQPVNPMQYF